MVDKIGLRSRLGPWSAGVLVLLALLPSWRSPGAAGARASRTPPPLLTRAAQQPATSIRVIVQVQRPSGIAGVERVVVGLGGRVTTTLPLIHAFAATLAVRAVPALTRTPGVRWVSRDAPVVQSGLISAAGLLPPTCASCIDTSHLQNAYIRAIGADKLWNSASDLQGQGIGVAVVDSGIAPHADFDGTNGSSRIVASVTFNGLLTSLADGYGHGTHVAGIIGGNGSLSSGGYIGVAPKVNLINVRVSSDAGATSTSDVVTSLQWVLAHKTTYNIRVVNLSLTGGVADSYNVDPLDAACEILWNNGIVVVVAAGNNGSTASGVVYPPANDPFVLTVGAVDDKGTASTSDDTLAPYSAYGTTSDGFAKPDVVAPGSHIISTLGSTSATMVVAHLDHLVLNPSYFRMSGTSMAAPMVSGAVALLLQAQPSLTPDQVKYRLEATAHPLGTGTGAGELDAYAAVNSATTASANTGLAASKVLTTGSQPVTWTTWNSANWSSANWSSANWSSANWSSDYWGP